MGCTELCANGKIKAESFLALRFTLNLGSVEFENV